MALGVLASVAAWSPGAARGQGVLWAPGGVPVTAAPGNQQGAVAVSDGAGGVIVVWEDSREVFGDPDVFGQRITASGAPLWATNGVAISTARDLDDAPSAKRDLALATDGVGGAIVAWSDPRSGQRDVYAQRVDAAGQPLWTPDGVAISTACWTFNKGCFNQKGPVQVVPDGSGGAIIAWQESRDGFNFSVWAQRVDAAGVALWQRDGVPVASGGFYALLPALVSDGAGGAIVAWWDQREVSARTFAQRIAPDGSPVWTVNGIEVAPTTGGQRVTADGAGGLIVVYGGVDGLLRAQRFDGNGAPLWGAGGVPIVARDSRPGQPEVAGDAGHGVLVVWADTKGSPGQFDPLIWAQRLDAQGQPLWSVDGIRVASVGGLFPSVAGDGAGGAFVVWDAFSLVGGSPRPALYAQHVGGDGPPRWAADGLKVYLQADGNYNFRPQALADGTGGVIVHWADYRISRPTPSYPELDVFAQRLSDAGPTAPFTLAVGMAGLGQGTVTSTLAGIDCGADCSEAYPTGTHVTLLAVPATAGSVLRGWAGACSAPGPCEVVMDGPAAVTAIFDQGPLRRLTVVLQGNGNGIVGSVPTGISCGADCSETYQVGTGVTLTAAPASDSVFLGWSGGGCSGTGGCTVTMNADTTVTANFASPTFLAAAVLPSSRSVQVGATATAFATIINAATSPAIGCGITLITNLSAAFSYQTTDPVTNQITGMPDTPVDIPAGLFQTYVFSLTPSAPIAPAEVEFGFDCANSNRASTIVGVNTLSFTASATPVPDIVALAGTLPPDPGIVNIPGTTGTGVFAVATVNVGASGSITAYADIGSAVLPVNIFLCQTNPITGACLAPLSTTVTTTINANATPTFSIFVQGTGNVAFNPATNRIFFRLKGAGNVTRGSTSVAVRTTQ